ncbi:MAG: MerR family transcriptional regulator [Gammaproteobacteria bacterium]|nr:MerR family transcriptional regulator [Gammaproteobacteria bacterium]MCZ6881381.1 MerR family transcriptional regulator [Gammaproteobacteria bacterium]
MKSKRVNITLSGVILDDQSEVTLEELCQSCRVEQSVIMALVEEGIVEPMSGNVQPWRFSATTLPRVVRALRLQRDFELNLAGVAFALDLINEIESLRTRLNRTDMGRDV